MERPLRQELNERNAVVEVDWNGVAVVRDLDHRMLVNVDVIQADGELFSLLALVGGHIRPRVFV